MPTLSDKLKSLGVKIGASDLKSPQKTKNHGIIDIIPGRFLQNYHGETFLLEDFYGNDYYQGSTPLNPLILSLGQFSDWINDERIIGIPYEKVGFLDTETTGLAGGTGTLAFLIGVGRYVNNYFHLAQFFLQDPAEEPALLVALEQFIASCDVLVTFNGKSFDIPLLRTRYQLQGWKDSLSNLLQIDLLHLARRLWRDRLASRSLINLEAQILKLERSEEDIPGWLIPQLYFDYLRDSDPEPLRKIFYHNSMDVLSMAALLNHCSALISDPWSIASLPRLDIISLAKFHEDLGHADIAIELFQSGIGNQDVTLDSEKSEILLDAIFRLARIYKRKSDYQSAIQLWKKAAQMNSIFACVELAKFYEHIDKDLNEALLWTRTALELNHQMSILSYERRNWLIELNYRLARIEKKMNPSGSD